MESVLFMVLVGKIFRGFSLKKHFPKCFFFMSTTIICRFAQDIYFIFHEIFEKL